MMGLIDQGEPTLFQALPMLISRSYAVFGDVSVNVSKISLASFCEANAHYYFCLSMISWRIESRCWLSSSRETVLPAAESFSPSI